MSGWWDIAMNGSGVWDDPDREDPVAEEPDMQIGSSLVRYADEAMFTAEPMTVEGDEVKPTVTIMDMTANPLRLITAVAGMYQGKVIRDPATVTMAEALETARGIHLSKIVAPAEWVHISLLFEGVTRAFTHQLVRQRTATYVQESLRFAVKEDARFAVALPPSLAGKPGDDPARQIWEDAVRKMAWSYNALIGAGMPAEDSRGLLPTNITTRVHYTTNLRNLIDHSGLRLCSQAQQEWKQVWREIIRAMLNYGPKQDRWQQRAITSMFKPVCYMTGKCEFMGPADRYCSIRERVEAHHARGERPELWDDINPLEPLHPEAARRLI